MNIQAQVFFWGLKTKVVPVLLDKWNYVFFLMSCSSFCVYLQQWDAGLSARPTLKTTYSFFRRVNKFFFLFFLKILNISLKVLLQTWMFPLLDETLQLAEICLLLGDGLSYFPWCHLLTMLVRLMRLIRYVPWPSIDKLLNSDWSILKTLAHSEQHMW